MKTEKYLDLLAMNGGPKSMRVPSAGAADVTRDGWLLIR